VTSGSANETRRPDLLFGAVGADSDGSIAMDDISCVGAAISSSFAYSYWERRSIDRWMAKKDKQSVLGIQHKET
jgi:hypothetical protein